MIPTARGGFPTSTGTPPGVLSGGGRGMVGTPPQRLASAPGSFRILLGAILCLPGGLLLALAAVMLLPGAALCWSGLRRLATAWGVQQPNEASRDPRQSLTWPMKGGIC